MLRNWKVNGNRLYVGDQWLGEICGGWWKAHEDGKTNALNQLLYVFMWANEDLGARLFAGTLLASLTLTKEQIRYGLYHLDVLWSITNDGVDLPNILRRQIKRIWGIWETEYLGEQNLQLAELENKVVVPDTGWWDSFTSSSKLVKTSGSKT